MSIDPEHYAIIRRMYAAFRVSSIEKHEKIGRSRNTLGGCYPREKRILIRKGQPTAAQERTLIHEGLHNINYSDQNEDEIEEATYEIHERMNARQRRRLRRFIPRED